MLQKLAKRVRSGLAEFIRDESGNATEYIIIAGIGVAILGAAIVAWNNGLASYLQGFLNDLTGL